MSTNQFLPVDYRIGSCLFGNRCYRVVSNESDFSQSLLEEILDETRQTPGTGYMTVRSSGSSRTLVMVPFQAEPQQLQAFLAAMDEVHACYMGTPGFLFPQDVAAADGRHAYLFSQEDLGRGTPLRILMPSVHGPRWEAAISLFRRVQTLRLMGLTSNGFSREQLRFDPDSGEVLLQLNHTLSRWEHSRRPDQVSRHRGFLALPDWTEEQCRTLGITVQGFHRDLFSAAAAAFYMLTCGHPFVGHAFNRIDRESYLSYYHSVPRYVMEPGSDNSLATSELHELTKARLSQTTPQLRTLFDQIFLAATRPGEYWKADLACWDPMQWIHALTQDKEEHGHETNQPDPQFDRWVYHLV